MSEVVARDQINFIRSMLDREIASCRERRGSYRKAAFGFKMVTVVISAVSTTLLALKQYDIPHLTDHVVSPIVIVLGAIIPILAGWDAFYDYRWLWIRNNATLMSLYGLSDGLDYERLAGPVPATRLDELFEQLQSILRDADNQWAGKRMTDLEQDRDKGKAEPNRLPS